MVSIPIIETVTSLVTSALLWGGLAMVVALMAVESFGIPPLPSEVILPFTGFLVFMGAYGFWAAFLAAVIGQLAGSFIAYGIGRWGRHYVVGSGRLQLDPKHLASMESWFRRRGDVTVLVARLLPVVRSYISYPAGTAKMNPTRFALFTVVGATPFTVALIYLGYVLNQEWARIVPYFAILNYLALAGVVGAIVYVLLRWRGKITDGFPPRLIRSTGPPPPAGGAPP